MKKFQDTKHKTTLHSQQAGIIRADEDAGSYSVPTLRMFEYLPDPRENYRDRARETNILVLETI